MRPHLKSSSQIEAMRKANLVVAEVLQGLAAMARPGITTLELDQEAEKICRNRGAVPAFKGYHGYPASLCTSVNHVIVHGIPSKDEILKEGDLLSLDFGAVLDGWVGDSAITVEIGEVSEDAHRLSMVTREALDLAIEQVRPGKRLSDIGRAVQTHAEIAGYSVIRDFVGHGIGREMHEDPQVPNYVPEHGPDPRLETGMVIAIEPMISAGKPDVEILKDGWTAVTADGSLAAHYEHSVAVTDSNPAILSRL
ncbi:MAG: type I methionyl aminopeptidase [Deltaproteobacteria bacterium]|nr:type I methionyl aminopeptidase [Deltaproteobacteria bacterium]